MDVDTRNEARIRELNDLLRRKAGDINERDNRIRGQREELKRLNDRIATLELAVATGNAAEASRLREQLSAKDVEIRHLRGQIAEKEISAKQLREQIDHFSNQVVGLRGEVRAATAAMAKNLYECCAAKEETAAVRKRLDAQTAQNKYLHWVVECDAKATAVRVETINKQTDDIRSLRDQLAAKVKLEKYLHETIENLNLQLAEAKKASEKPAEPTYVRPGGWSFTTHGGPRSESIFTAFDICNLEWIKKSLHDKQVAELRDLNLKCARETRDALQQLGVAKGELDAANRHCKIRGDKIAELEKQIRVFVTERRAVRDLLD